MMRYYYPPKTTSNCIPNITKYCYRLSWLCLLLLGGPATIVVEAVPDDPSSSSSSSSSTSGSAASAGGGHGGGAKPIFGMLNSGNGPAKVAGETFEDMFQSVDHILEHSTIAGQITPILQKFFITSDQIKAIWGGISQVAQWFDIMLLITVGWLLVPMLESKQTSQIFSGLFRHSKSNKASKNYYSSRQSSSWGFEVVRSLSQLARLAMAVYLVDIVKIILVGLGFNIPRGDRLTHAFAYVAYSIWMFSKISNWKRHILFKWTRNHEGRIQILNRLADAVLYVAALFFILDILQVEMGLALQGVLAFSSVGTLAFSLASQGIVKQILNGILLSASDRIYEGDFVQFGSGLSGTIVKLGWIETVLRGSDEIFVSVPNADLISQEVSNLSRVNLCQVKQVLRFPHEDATKLPQLMQDIKTEIRVSCPSLITDGSRPFRAHWTNICADHLEATVDVHFRIKPIGDPYFDNRQHVLEAIDRAVAKNKMEYKLSFNPFN